ncbi:unnamed protein product [Colias eurytheme]|nr:unnamed protein product [Colias eurytheme]
MHHSIVFVFVFCLLKHATSQCIGTSLRNIAPAWQNTNLYPYNQPLCSRPVYNPTTYVTSDILNVPVPCDYEVPYGGYGEGYVDILGELPVQGSTHINGHVPVLGMATFSGNVPASGIITITGKCGCGCE